MVRSKVKFTSKVKLTVMVVTTFYLTDIGQAKFTLKRLRR